MSEQKVVKRAWVKNAAIIFLAVMLVLTFFSNTILNRSLPEVATSYVESGTITAKVRGSGTITAKQTYEVVLHQTREISSVPVKVGDVVAAGDVLFTLGDAESSELKTARDALEALKLDYQKRLITNSSSGDYTQDERAITRARDTLTAAQATRDKNLVLATDLTAAETAITEAKSKVKTWEKNVKDLTAWLAELGVSSKTDYTDSSSLASLTNQIKAKKTSLETITGQLANAETKYKAAMAELQALAYARMDPALSEEQKKLLLDGYMQRVAEELPEGDEKKIAFKTITGYQEQIKQLNNEIESLNQRYNDLLATEMNAEQINVKNQLDSAQEKLAKYQEEQATAEKNLEELKSKQEAYNAAVEDVAAKETALDDLMFALAEKKKTDGISSKVALLELDALKQDINQAQSEYNKLLQDSTGGEITAKQAGVIKSINISAGNTAPAETVLAVIESPESGYYMSFAVTSEQAKKVSIGDQAEVYNSYWGPQILATLTAIKSDPANPQKNKLLEFTVSGEDIVSGSTLTLSLGQKSANYDMIVPNSAIRSDNNGSFVLIVNSKNTPLGTRYIAQRVDIRVLASDDINTAISGGLSAYDYVITTSNKPVNPGSQVRLAEK